MIKGIKNKQKKKGYKMVPEQKDEAKNQLKKIKLDNVKVITIKNDSKKFGSPKC